MALTGIVCADQPVPAVPDIQGISTVTSMDIIGITTVTGAVAWALDDPQGYPVSLTDPILMNYPNWGTDYPDGSGWGSYADFLDYANYWGLSTVRDMIEGDIALNDGYQTDADVALANWLQGQGGLQNPTLFDREVRYSTAYDANVVAQGGHTVFTKTMSLNTGDKVIGQSNINAQTGFTFAGTAGGGNVVGSENLMIDGAGMTTDASDRMLCPFGSQLDNVIPAFCNIVQVGSKYDLTIGSVTTNANERFVGTDATNPVVLNYDINVKPYTIVGQGTFPAMGSTSAYLKAHIQEARDFNTSQIDIGDGDFMTTTGITTLVEDLTYSEVSSAQGSITTFNKVISYQSGKSILPG